MRIHLINLASVSKSHEDTFKLTLPQEHESLLLINLASVSKSHEDTFN